VRAGRRVERTPEERGRERVAAHRYGDLVAAVTEETTFASRPMFGCVACYVHGRLKLVLADGRRPWNGILVPTARDHHGSLRRALPALRVHPILGKWLHLAAGGDDFEDDVARLVALVLADDDRVGVEPTPTRARPGASRRSRRG
jgi:hypothetical protein